ncbi:hypothetical protein O181_017893 [Austropuccinia psidii MF-1]|uniref:Uncharacterized protein n=1 Tax=Austropuccinia psidii MF-1 TaxID=1389203 RepID=A0A9Q3GS70_9BASI|nr:hypothetical protein [Austropuccinia psidii MF-1]
MNQLLTVFKSSTIFSKIYLCGAYNILRIIEEDEHLTAFKTKYGGCEYLVMPFGLTNAPSSFERRLATSPEALSCQEKVYPERRVDFIKDNLQNFHQVLKQNKIKESTFFSIKAEVFSDLVDQIHKEVWQDKYYKEIIKQLARGESVSDYSLEPPAKLLLFKDRVVIPRNHEIQLDIF